MMQLHWLMKRGFSLVQWVGFLE